MYISVMDQFLVEVLIVVVVEAAEDDNIKQSISLTPISELTPIL